MIRHRLSVAALGLMIVALIVGTCLAIDTWPAADGADEVSAAFAAGTEMTMASGAVHAVR